VAARDSSDRFEAAYGAGVIDGLAPPDRGRGGEAPVRAAPAGALALKGCVLTPVRAIEKGYVVVGGDSEIRAVQQSKPQGVPVHGTGGVILPGLIDLHGHPEFNVFAAWEPPRRFVNRYAWRGSELYRQLVRAPQNLLLAALPAKVQLRYAEVRALVGGVTAIQGTGGQASYQDEALVRNVDKWIFGAHRARSMIDLPSGSRGMPELAKIRAGIEAGEVEAFYIHLAEGRADNERSGEKFGRLVELGALTSKTVVIYGTALAAGGPLGERRRGGPRLGRAGHDRRRPRLRPRRLDRGARGPAGPWPARAADRLGQADAARHELHRPPRRRGAAAARRTARRADRRLPPGGTDLCIATEQRQSHGRQRGAGPRNGRRANKRRQQGGTNHADN
jgi:hypothetical protein